MAIHNLLFNLSNANWNLPDPGNAGALPRAKTGIINIVSAGSETRTLAAPLKEGIILGLNFLTDGGDCVVTVASAIDDFGTTTITFDDAGEFVLLISRKFGTGYRWRVIVSSFADAVGAMTAGAGVSAAESYSSGVFQSGDLIHTRIAVDLTGLVGSTTDLDIIGNTGAASANFGQITTARNGTIIGGQVTCLEVPAGGADDLDFYSASVGTGTENVAITDAALGTETALVTSGAAWASGTVKGMTGLPTANDYLYIVNGEAGVPGTFSAGKFLIELYGAAA